MLTWIGQNEFISIQANKTYAKIEMSRLPAQVDQGLFKVNKRFYCHYLFTLKRGNKNLNKEKTDEFLSTHFCSGTIDVKETVKNKTCEKSFEFMQNAETKY